MGWSPKCSQPWSSIRLTLEPDVDSLAGLEPAHDRESDRLGNGREQLVVLAEAEVVDRGSLCQGNTVEVDDAADARAAGEVAGVHRDPVRDVDHGVRGAREPLALFEAQRPAGRTPSGGRAPRRRRAGR